MSKLKHVAALTALCLFYPFVLVANIAGVIWGGLSGAFCDGVDWWDQQ